MKHKRLFFLFLFIASQFLQACSTPKTCDEVTNGEKCLRILFIGNSYTFSNDLPGTFVELARAGGHLVEAQMVANGGWGFSDHMASPDTLTAIQSKEWDYVVLQEQSTIPAAPYSRTNYMYPAARVLVNQIRSAGAKPVFFVTWGHKNGEPDMGIPNYVTMQAWVDQGYLAIAQELNVTLAPVGTAWYIAQKDAATPELWQEDGSHPTLAGTYLAANVFYATIFLQSPVGLSYRGTLPKDVAAHLQAIASKAVLNTP
jgi:hypothetical protein